MPVCVALHKKWEAEGKENVKREREQWIDWIKGVCMIAVVLNHTYGVLYTSRRILYSTVFAVMLFVFMSGWNSGNSMKEWMWSDRDYIYRKTGRRIWKIWGPYILSIALFCILLYHRLDIPVFMNYLFDFSVWGSYFVCFLTQLILAAPFIFMFFQHWENKIVLQLAVLAVTGILSLLSVYYTSAGNFLFGAKYILGGVYFFIFSLGIFCSFHMEEIFRHKALAGGISFFYMCCFQISGCGKEAWGKDLSLPVMLYSLSVFAVLYWVGHQERLFERGGVFWIFRTTALFGRYSLYIFLFHFPLIALFSETAPGGKILGVVFKCISFACVLYVPVLMNKGMAWIARKLKIILFWGQHEGIVGNEEIDRNEG